MDEKILWSALSVESALQSAGSSLEGLAPDQVRTSAQRFGRNVLPPPRERTRFQVFSSQFQSALIYILLIASVISLLLREWQDALVISAVVLLNAAIGYRQEVQANTAMSKLLQLAPPVVHVIRQGQEQELVIGDLVVGDIVVVETGDGLPADGRWVDVVNVRVNESSLTGESVPVEKIATPLPIRTIIQDRRNMGWRGTLVIGGRGKLLVTEIGINTRFGSIVANLQKIDHQQTPFQKKISGFSRRLAVVTVFLGLIIFLLGIARHLPGQQMFLLAVSMIVSIIPEGLPVVITMAMAYGMWAMSKRQAIVRKLAAVETLGAVTVVATDKTGTLTYGEMMMARAWVDGREYHLSGKGYRPEGDIFLDDQKIIGRADDGLNLAFRLGALNNDSRFSRDVAGQRTPIGDPTELALLVAAEKIGWSRVDLAAAHPRVGEFPFDYNKKYMITWHHDGAGLLVVIKGAPQEVLSLCRQRWTASGPSPLTDDDRRQVTAVYERWAGQALRGLAVAYTHRPNRVEELTAERLGGQFTFVGLFGLEDALRPEAAEAIQEMHQAGIKTIMVTGDYRHTGRAVAARLGLLPDQRADRLLDGSDIDALDDRTLRRRLVLTTVATRLTPEHKLRLAKLLKQEGQIVAMTGDGINDAPALLEANVGIAVGRGSSAAAKEAADVLLVDGNFLSIVAAIAEGRRIFRNIRRVIYYLLATSFGELILVMTALMAGLPLPLLPTQIIWLNAITGPFLGLALAREPMAPSVMQEQPHDPRAQIIPASMWHRILLTGSAIGVTSLIIFQYGLKVGMEEPRLYALVLTSVVAAELVNAITARSSRRSLLIHATMTRSMAGAIVGVLILQATIIYLPVLAAVFHLAPLTIGDWLIIILAAAPVFGVEELRKWWIRRRSERPMYLKTTPV
ncbi:MAG: HAD-IC family P-type ATPase [Patescibacteria group bacterium]